MTQTLSRQLNKHKYVIVELSLSGKINLETLKAYFAIFFFHFALFILHFAFWVFYPQMPIIRHLTDEF